MPRKKAARNAGETSESEDPAEILATAQQKMGTLQRSRNRRRRAVANKHAEEFDRVKKRIDARMQADRKRLVQAQKEALKKHFDAVASVLEIEKKIERRTREMHRQCSRFVKLLSLVHDGRAEEALQVDLEKLERRVSSGAEA